MLEALNLKALPDPHDYGPNEGVSPDFKTPFPPDIADLQRLYGYVRERRVSTILEFGSGYSTAVLAHALEQNRQEYSASPEFSRLRRNNPFELHSIDCSQEWLNVTRSRIPKQCRDRLYTHHSIVQIGTFNDRICHYYSSLPNITPDLIYLDGPSAFDVEGEVAGISFAHNDRTVIAGDIARMEWLLLPGTLIVVDGRTNNARFLRSNLQRVWHYEFDPEGDVHTFELREPPLGALNRRQLDFCLRERDWS